MPPAGENAPQKAFPETVQCSPILSVVKVPMIDPITYSPAPFGVVLLKGALYWVIPPKKQSPVK